MDAPNYIRYTCEGCSTAFEAIRPRRYCTKNCNKAHIRQKKSGIPRAEYLANIRENAKSKFTCEHCGVVAYRGLSGSSDSANRFCSMLCRSDSAAKANNAQREVDAKVRQEVDALRRIARHIERPMVFSANCIRCANHMLVRRTKGLHKRVCEDCIATNVRRLRNIGKAKRRASVRGVRSDNIDPIKVFERDRWKCHICGVKTLKSLRGSYEPKAPELEHIVSLSQGGSHTWGNVACSCRKCNGEKGSKSFGQLGLDIGV